MATRKYKYTASVEWNDRKVTVHTTDHYYVVQGFVGEVRQVYYRTTVFSKCLARVQEMVPV